MKILNINARYLMLAILTMLGWPLFLTTMASADDWPNRPVTIIVPYNPGASNDTFTRALAVSLSEKLGQPFVVENRPGASGYMALLQVSRVDPDGYTFVQSPNAIASFGSILEHDLDPVTELQAVGMMARAPIGLFVPGSLPVSTLEEFIDYVNERPNELFYGFVGQGSLTRFLTEHFVQSNGLPMSPISYTSAGDGLLDLAAGRIHFMLQTPAISGQVRSGQLKVLAYTSEVDSDTVPPAPLFADAGVEGMIGESWWGIFAPKELPPEILEEMNAAINESLTDPAFITLLENSGALPEAMSPDEFSEVVAQEAAMLERLKDELNIVIEQ